MWFTDVFPYKNIIVFIFLYTYNVHIFFYEVFKYDAIVAKGQLYWVLTAPCVCITGGRNNELNGMVIPLLVQCGFCFHYFWFCEESFWISIQLTSNLFSSHLTNSCIHIYVYIMSFVTQKIVIICFESQLQWKLSVVGSHSCLKFVHY